MTNFTITITSHLNNRDQITKFLLSNLTQYMDGNNTVECDSSAISITVNCTLSADKNTLSVTNLNASQIFQNPFVLKLKNLYVRPTINFSFMSIKSYSKTNYLASEFNKIDFGALCKLPCK